MQNLSYHLMLLLLRAIALLPLWVLYGISDFACWLTHSVIKYRVAVVRRNLRGAFPDKTEAELQAIENGFYKHLGDCIVETVKLLHISERELDRRVEVRGGEIIDRMAADGRPVILFLGHYGNWEWVQQISRHYSSEILSGELYRPVRSPLFNRLMQTIRSRFKTQLITQKQAVRTLIGLYREKRKFIIGFIADQRPNSSNLNHWTTFLQQDTPVAVGGEEIGRHISAHYAYLDIEKPRRGYYRMTVSELQPAANMKDYPMTASFLRALEQTILRKPELWLWSHNRWKFERVQQDGKTIVRKKQIDKK